MSSACIIDGPLIYHVKSCSNASGNQLSGELGTSLLSNIPSLKTLDLSSNQFLGTIPDLSLLENIEFM